jgi:hypothetical protein
MTYKIIRFTKSGAQRTMKRGLTLAEAQKHCNDPATEGETWFDGYMKEEPTNTVSLRDINAQIAKEMSNGT